MSSILGKSLRLMLTENFRYLYNRVYCLGIHTIGVWILEGVRPDVEVENRKEKQNTEVIYSRNKSSTKRRTNVLPTVVVDPGLEGISTSRLSLSEKGVAPYFRKEK